MIDSGLPDPWPTVIRDAAAAFEQGDVVKQPPFFYWASLEHPVWDVSIEVAALGDGDPLISLDLGDGPPLGIVTTQSCDLDEADPKKPWFHVAPVFEAGDFGDSNLANIRAQMYGYLYALPSVPGEHGDWVADLRVEFPIEKGWLVGKSPIRCLSFDQGREFARKLGRAKARPALDGPPDIIVQHLRKAIGNMKEGKRTRILGCLPADGLRVKLIGAGREVTGLQLYVLSKTGAPDEETQAWFEAWRSRVQAKVPDDFDFLGTIYESLDSLSALAYRDLVQLDFL